MFPTLVKSLYRALEAVHALYYGICCVKFTHFTGAIWIVFNNYRGTLEKRFSSLSPEHDLAVTVKTQKNTVTARART